MKTIILTILLATSLCYARIPLITCDPNTIIDSPADPNNVRVTIQVEITKEQYAAMQELNVSFVDILQQSRLSRMLDRVVERTKRELTRRFTVTELKAKIERE